MTTQNKIRRVLTNHWCQQNNREGKRAWLIKGDFDHFKLMNELYGSLICDYLLDWTLDVIEAELKSHQKRWGDSELLWNFVGDDVTLYIPPSALQEEEIDLFLREICDSIAQSFFHRYQVAAISLSPGFFDDIPMDRLEQLRGKLERMDVVLDFARRQRGYLTLFPMGPHDLVLSHLLQVLWSESGKPIPPVGLHPDWIFDPDDQAAHVFNEGFLWVPSISFAACPIRMRANGDSMDRRSVYERVSLSCQSALKVCKQHRKHVFVQRADPLLLDDPSIYQPSGVLALYSPLRWSSERYLRETLYFRQLEQVVLFQFNPVYHSNSERYASAMAGDPSRVEKYRGNQYGVGLKGINEIFGQNAADCLIGELTWVFSKVMQSALVEKGIPLTGVHIARFVDRFTVCCEQPLFQLKEIEELIGRLTGLFNCVSEEIKIAQIRMSFVQGEPNSAGCHLFHQLALTGLSSRPVILENTVPAIELRQNHPASALREGNIALERASFSSAQRLNAYKDVTSNTVHAQRRLFEKKLSRLSLSNSFYSQPGS
jgi:GGDEF domain-containing protein